MAAAVRAEHRGEVAGSSAGWTTLLLGEHFGGC